MKHSGVLAFWVCSLFAFTACHDDTPIPTDLRAPQSAEDDDKDTNPEAVACETWHTLSFDPDSASAEIGQHLDDVAALLTTGWVINRQTQLSTQDGSGNYDSADDIRTEMDVSADSFLSEVRAFAVPNGLVEGTHSANYIRYVWFAGGYEYAIEFGESPGDRFLEVELSRMPPDLTVQEYWYFNVFPAPNAALGEVVDPQGTTNICLGDTF